MLNEVVCKQIKATTMFLFHLPCKAEVSICKRFEINLQSLPKPQHMLYM